MVAPAVLAAIIGAAGTIGGAAISRGGGGGGGKNKQLPTQTREQKELDKLIAEYIKTGEGPLKDYFPQFNKDEFQQGVANPAIRKYQEDILPQILEKYNAGNQSLGSGQLRAEVRGQTDLQSQLDQLMYNSKNQSDRDRSNAVLQLLGIHQGKGSVENLYKQPAPSTASGFASGLANNAGPLIKGAMDAYSSSGTNNNFSGPGYSPYTEPVHGASSAVVG